MASLRRGLLADPARTFVVLVAVAGLVAEMVGILPPLVVAYR